VKIKNEHDLNQSKLLDAINRKAAVAHRAADVAKGNLAERVASHAASGINTASDAVKLARIARNWHWVLQCAARAVADGGTDVSGAVTQCQAGIRRSIEFYADQGQGTCPFHNAVAYAEVKGDIETLREIENLPGVDG